MVENERCIHITELLEHVLNKSKFHNMIAGNRSSSSNGLMYYNIIFFYMGLFVLRWLNFSFIQQNNIMQNPAITNFIIIVIVILIIVIPSEYYSSGAIL